MVPTWSTGRAVRGRTCTGARSRAAQLHVPTPALPVVLCVLVTWWRQLVWPVHVRRPGVPVPGARLAIRVSRLAKHPAQGSERASLERSCSNWPRMRAAHVTACHWQLPGCDAETMRDNCGRQGLRVLAVVLAVVCNLLTPTEAKHGWAGIYGARPLVLTSLRSSRALRPLSRIVVAIHECERAHVHTCTVCIGHGPCARFLW